jgi:hypothetical protein
MFLLQMPVTETNLVQNCSGLHVIAVRNSLSFALTGCFLLVACAGAHAGTDHPKFAAGAEIGAGALERRLPETRTDSKFYLAFNGGYRPTNRLLFGVEIGGFTISGGSRWDPTKGAGISQRFLIAQYHLRPGFEGWYLKGGAGKIRYWDNRPGGVEESGSGWLVAIGHDRVINNLGRFGPLLLYSRGDSDSIEHRGLALALRWSFP